MLVNIEYCDDDYEGWIEESDKSLDSLLDLRTDMINGDFSCLYAFWLKILSLKEEVDDEEDGYKNELPALPPGLAKPSSALKSFVDLYGIDEILIKAAGSFINKSSNKNTDYQALIAQMGDSTKNEWLMRLINGETLLDIKLRKQLTTSEAAAPSSKITFEKILAKAFGR